MYGTGRKFFSLLLAWVLIFTLVPASAFAEAGSEDLITGTNGLSAINVGTDTDITEGGQDPSQEQQQGGEPELAQRTTGVEPQGLLWHTVTFDSQGGTAVAPQSVRLGKRVTEPPVPTKSGYKFLGWYYNGYAWNFSSDTVWWDITLSAKWEEIPAFTVTFDSNGGSPIASQSVYSGSTVTKPGNPTLGGHTFEGWYKNQNLTGKWDFANDTVTENITLYAKWEQIPAFTVTFDCNGGSLIASQSVYSGSTVTKPGNPTLGGHMFEGWYRNQNLTGKWDFANDTVTENITLYAKWEEIPAFTVTFDCNGGSPIASQSVYSGSTVTKPGNPTLGGHTFEGWYRNQNLAGKWDFANDTVTENITLYAKWKVNPGTCTVTFDSKGGSEVVKQFVTFGGKISKPTDPTLNGYTFEGWYYKECGLEFVWNFDSYRVWQSFTLYAKWEAIPTYTVTFNSNGGSDVASIAGLTGGAKITKPSNPTLEGHTFEGWFKNENLTGEWDFDTDTVTENVTLYAKWEAITTYTVTFNSNGGTTVSSISGLASGSKIIKPTDPTKTGYTFAGWYKNTELTSAWDFENGTVTQDITLFAKWQAIPTFTVTFNSNGGTTVSSISGLASGSKITKPADPWKSGYSFGGWYKDSSLTNAWNFTTDTISGNTTLYAQWYYNYIPSYYYGGCYSNYVYPYQLVIPKTGGMVSLLPYALLSASALCAAIVTKRKRDS